jgi:DNA-binding transcriptional LysR family regulator
MAVAARAGDFVDLNRVVLAALLEERHVSRAALRVGLSQPAMSNALARLRVTFGDALLVRTPSGMELADRARELAGPIGLALRQAERVFTSDREAPALCRRIGACGSRGEVEVYPDVDHGFAFLRRATHRQGAEHYWARLRGLFNRSHAPH